MSRVLVSIGDPHGIGPELAVTAAAAGDAVVVGDRFVVEPPAAARGLTVRETDGTARPEAGVLDLLRVDALAPAAWAPGTVSAAAGAATVRYVTAAVAAVRDGRGRAVVACPHSETAVNRSGRAFAGYPGLLAELTGVPRDRVFLLLVGGGLRMVHATLHERLADALARLTPDLVVAAARAAADHLVAAGIPAPRIGLCGINPHAGEDGLFGGDDARVTEPAAAALRALGVDVVGPLGADLLLAPERRAALDACVALYHDQGHVPVKTLAGRDCAAVSLGGGVAFASVGHGPAFDLVGTGRADPGAVLAALRAVAG